MNTIRKWYNDALVWAFLTLGTKLFGAVFVGPGSGDDPIKAIHFAATERDLNNSMRDYVEKLNEKET
jgi:hypothetical protein